MFYKVKNTQDLEGYVFALRAEAIQIGFEEGLEIIDEFTKNNIINDTTEYMGNLRITLNQLRRSDGFSMLSKNVQKSVEEVIDGINRGFGNRIMPDGHYVDL